MVGSINAPTTGDKTLAEYIFGASKASDSSAPPTAPIGGVLQINGNEVKTGSTNVIDTSGAGAPPAAGNNPPPPPVNNPPTGTNPASPVEPPVMTALPSPPAPDATLTPDTQNMAGGPQPAAYGWAPAVSDNATNLLQLINWVDNALVDLLVNGHRDITEGQWKGKYPPTIQNVVGSMGAQSIVHRHTSTDSLSHYKKPVVQPCKYKFPKSNIEEFVKTSLTIVLLEIGLLLDTIGLVVSTDIWMVGPLASTIGSKARMAGLINMMQNHIPAAAPREVAMPANLVYSYIMTNYVEANSCPDKLPFTTYPALPVVRGPVENKRLKSVTVTYDDSKKAGLKMAYLGPWGKTYYEAVTPDANKPGSGTVNVPADLSGHVWGVLVSGEVQNANDLHTVTVAGPEMIWVSEP